MSECGSNSSNARVAKQSGCSCGAGACTSSGLDGGQRDNIGSALLSDNPSVFGLPTDPSARKSLPIGTAVLDYFPLALAALARVSLVGQKQHSVTGWDKSKSTDHADALVRHFLERGTIDSDGCSHSAKMAWRAMAIVELEEEAR